MLPIIYEFFLYENLWSLNLLVMLQKVCYWEEKKGKKSFNRLYVFPTFYVMVQMTILFNKLPWLEGNKSCLFYIKYRVSCSLNHPLFTSVFWFSDNKTVKPKYWKKNLILIMPETVVLIFKREQSVKLALLGITFVVVLLPAFSRNFVCHPFSSWIEHKYWE